MKLSLFWLLSSSLLSVGGEWPGSTVLRVESALETSGSEGNWSMNPKAACRLAVLTNGTANTLRYRYGYESEPNQTYLLKRQFTWWSNGLAHGSVTLSNLISGNGATRWETSEVVGRVENGVATFAVGGEVLKQFQLPNPKPQESLKPQAPGVEFGVGLTRVTLEHYGIRCTGCAGQAEPGQPGLVYGGNELRFSLGRTWYGQAVGELALALQTPGPELSGPGALRLLALPGSVTVVRRGGQLRQVGARQCLVDILKLGERKYQLLYYSTNAFFPEHVSTEIIPTNGLMPSVRWIIEELSGAAQGPQLRVLEASGSMWVTNLYTWNEAGWELLAGNGLRKEVCARTCDANGQDRTEVWQTLEPAGNRLVAQRTTKYRLFSWGEELVEELLGLNGEGGTNRWSYCDTPGSAATGRLREVARSDGSWERFEYDDQGRLVSHWSPFANTPPERYPEGIKVSYAYAPWLAWGDTGEHFPLRPRTITESVGDKVVSKTYFIAGPESTLDVRCAAPSRAPFDGPVLCTTNRLYAADAWNRSRLKSVEHADGTMETFQYHSSPFATTEIHCAGEPDAAHAGVVSGTETMTVLGDVGQVLLKAVYDVAPGRTNLLLYREAYTYLDALQRSYEVDYLDGTSNVVQYACCGLDSRRDRDGVLELYGYDALKRIQTVMRFAGNPEPVTTRYTFDAANHLRSVLRVGQGGRDSVRLRAAAYDTAGRVQFETNGLGGVTRFTYGFDSVGRCVSTREFPDGGKRVETLNRDGTLYELSGSAVHGLRHEYGVSDSGQRFTREIKLDESGQPTQEWVKEFVDVLGRPVRTEYPDGAHSQQFYNGQGQLSRERDPDGVLTLYGYNTRGERDTEALRVNPANSSEAIDWAGTDRVKRTLRDVVLSPAAKANVERWRHYVWEEAHSRESNLVVTVERSVDGLRSWETIWNEEAGATRRTELVPGADGVQERYVYAADGSWNYYRYRCGRLQLAQERDGLGGTNSQSSFRYDAHERLLEETQWRQGTLTYTYNDADLLAVTMREAAGPGQKSLPTRREYNSMLQMTNVVLPGGASIHTEYQLTGEIKQRDGWHSFPAAYTSDYAGRVKTMTTWRNARDTNTASTIVWNYEPQRGWLTQKRYADGTGPDYAHTPGGKLRKRTWAREVAPGSGVRVETVYGYNTAGDLATVSYNDGSTPDVKYEYDRRGRLQTVTQATRASAEPATLTRLTFNRSGQPTSESYLSGPLMGLVVTNCYDSGLRRTNLTLRRAATVLDSVVYDYEGGARLKTVTRPTVGEARPVSATYSYEEGTPRVSKLEFREGDAARLVCTRRYDAEGRPLSSAATPSGSDAMTQGYAYDETGQTARVTQTDCSYWLYEYDALGQLRQGRKFRSDQSPVPGQQLQYDFDDTGARLNGWAVGPDSGRTGKAGAQPLAGPRYDADGNLTNDGRWSFTWDAENRLVRAEANSRAEAHLRLDFAYDWRGRRLQKEASTWNRARQQYERMSRVSFAYDDWNLLAALNAEGAPMTSFTWGVDLNAGPAGGSGGGAGGLLLVGAPGQARWAGASGRAPETYFAVFDGHGNLIGLVSARDGKTAVQYDYGPFGEPLPGTSSAAVRPGFRFTTRFEDEETGLLYCGFRYYSPHLGRWMSREPLHEYAFWKVNEEALLRQLAGDRGLFGPDDYAYLANAPVGNVDALGLVSSCDQAVQKALLSRGSRKLLRMMERAGFPPPRVAGSDTEHYCSFPGYLGDYDCPNREGKICCSNVEGAEAVERTTRHELVHALDCCRNGLETCHDHICSEVVAYYLADCERFVNRLQCALDQMRSSMAGDTRCAAEVQAMSERAAWKCVQEWKKREGGP